MTTVQDILTFVETLAPRELKMDWDNVGLNCGSRHNAVTKILVALDPFEHVCQEAVDIGADLVVTHHPLIFRPIPMVTDDAAITRGIMNLCRHNISHVIYLLCASQITCINRIKFQILFYPVVFNAWHIICEVTKCITCKSSCMCG